MNEVTKLYENAGVEKSKCWDDCTTCTRTSCDKNISYIKAEYPPFTAEKQLAIVKQILFSTWWMNLKRLQFSEKFDEGLAQMINELWQDLTEEEQEEIRKILKGE